MENDFKNIVLTGFMGTGKTTLGKIISRKSGRRFFDTDVMIEEYCNMSIRDIFDSKGEVYFRETEKRIVSHVSKSSSCIIACGGGVVKNEENRKELKRNGIIICLKADADTIIERVGNDIGRPLIYGLSRGEVENLMKEREPFYNTADIFIDTSHDSPDTLSERIIKLCGI